MVKDHVERGAGCTVGCIEVPRMEAVAFGVMAIDDKRMVTAFVEKPADPPAMPGHPDMALASMGIYVFDANYLYQLLEEDLANPESSHDFGKDVLPRVVAGRPRAGASVQHVVHCQPQRRAALLARRRHHRRLLGRQPRPGLDQPRTRHLRQRLADLDLPAPAAAGQVRARPQRQGNGQQVNTIVSGGCIVSGSGVRNSVLFSSVRVHSFCDIEQAVILPDVEIGRGCKLKKVVIDRGMRLP